MLRTAGRHRRRAVWALAALAGLGLGLTFARYRRDIVAARQRVTSGSELAQTRCGSIEYGLAFGEPLVRSGFRIIAMSRFGYLRTPLPHDASAATQADTHACLLDALNIGKRLL